MSHGPFLQIKNKTESLIYDFFKQQNKYVKKGIE